MLTYDVLKDEVFIFNRFGRSCAHDEVVYGEYTRNGGEHDRRLLNDLMNLSPQD